MKSVRKIVRYLHSLFAGLATDPAAPSSFGGWMNHACSYHTGAISFIVMDLFLFFGVAALTIAQGSQVSLDPPHASPFTLSGFKYLLH